MTSLSKILRLNAASCLGFGALFVLAPGPVAEVLGQVPVWVIRLLGVGLLGNGFHLVLASGRAEPRPGEILWFSLGDLTWWCGSLFLIATGIWVTRPMGLFATGLVALAVAGLGLAQLHHLGRTRFGRRGNDQWRAIGRSWLALPLWVKLWLVLLNGVFLAALAFVPSPMAQAVLAAYVASGPLLIAFAVFQGGLSRVMGLGHLVPWLPLLVWLPAWAAAPGRTDLETTYGVALSVCLAICLGFDVYDILRWLRGDRAIIGADARA